MWRDGTYGAVGLAFKVLGQGGAGSSEKEHGDLHGDVCICLRVRGAGLARIECLDGCQDSRTTDNDKQGSEFGFGETTIATGFIINSSQPTSPSFFPWNPVRETK